MTVGSDRDGSDKGSYLQGQAERVKHLFDEYGEGWAARYKNDVSDVSQLDLVLRAGIVQGLLRSRGAGLRRPARLLDIGCGTGHVLSALPADEYSIVGMDFAEGMVRVAAAEHPERRFLVADARSLPLPSGSFDRVTMVGVLEYIVESSRAIGEISRVLRPDGVLVISVPNAASWFRRLHSLERTVTAPLRALLGKSASGYRQFRWNESTLQQLLANEGFAIEAVEYCTYGLKTPMFERMSANLNFCTWASRQYRASSPVSRNLAWTLVVCARRASSA
jgi:2-polyprenyl-6-hydroxyphenyl methylase/3-demethylubiquinone-9 3-methyltransferase